MTPKEVAIKEDTYTVTAAEKTGDIPVTLEEFLTRKLGASTGKKLYKELAAAVKDCVNSAGNPAIDLSVRRGAFVALRAIN